MKEKTVSSVSSLIVGNCGRFLSSRWSRVEELGDTLSTCYLSQVVLTAWQLTDWDHWEDPGPHCDTKLKTKNKLPRSARSKQLTLDFGPSSQCVDIWTWKQHGHIMSSCWRIISLRRHRLAPAWLPCYSPGLRLCRTQPRYLWCKLYSEQGLVMSCKCSLSHFLHRHIILDKIKCGAPHNKGINRLASQ